MTNKDKSLALINTFATGDTEVAANLLDEGCIQHDLAYGTGRDRFRRFRSLSGFCCGKDHGKEYPRV